MMSASNPSTGKEQAMSATAQASRDQDIAAIRRLVQDADEFQTDTARFTGLMTDDVMIVNFAGIRVQGRDRLREVMARALETPLANVMTSNEVVDITFVGPDVALVSCMKRITDGNEDTATAFPTEARLLYVLVHDGDVWRIASAQTTPIAS
jgi:uncharacterized protein (TIGR02246 family)